MHPKDATVRRSLFVAALLPLASLLSPRNVRASEPAAEVPRETQLRAEYAFRPVEDYLAEIVGIKLRVMLQINKEISKCLKLEKPVPCEGTCRPWTGKFVEDAMNIDTDAILRQALLDASKPRADGRSDLGDFIDLAHAVPWLYVLASPPTFARLGRVPSPSHLLKIVDDFLHYVRSGEHITTPAFTPVRYELREERTLALRSLLERWTPPALPVEVVHAARDVLEAEGLHAADDWETFSFPPGNVDDSVWWPESAKQ
jgi:hypothetical protein